MSYKQGKYDKYLQWTVDKKTGLVTVTANLEYRDGVKQGTKRIEIDASTVKRVLLGAGVSADKLVSSDPRVNNYQLDNQTGQWIWTIKGHNVKTAGTESTPRKSTREAVSTPTPARTRTRKSTRPKKTLTSEKTPAILEQKDINIQEGG